MKLFIINYEQSSVLQSDLQKFDLFDESHEHYLICKIQRITFVLMR